ncbi:MAG TPA: sulfatase [Kofleriaceae bacterium]|nr:sulfatase [Kofleriaceae bacterium]
MRSDSQSLSLAAAVLAGWGLVALIDVVMITATVAWPDGGLGVRALVYGYDIGHVAAAGLLSFAAAVAWTRFGARAKIAGYSVLWGVALVVCFVLVEPDLEGAARKLAAGGDADMWLWALVCGGAAVIPAAAVVGRFFARPWLRWAAVVVAAIAVAVNHVILKSAYPGPHLLLSWAGAVFAGAALDGARVPWSPPRSPWPARLAVGVGILAGALAWATVPGNAVVLSMLESPGSVFAPFWAHAHATIGHGRPVHGETAAWYRSRADQPPIPASEPSLIGDDGIVILITIDAVRADVLQSGKYVAKLPTLTRLRDEAVRFEMARSPGSQTVNSLTSLFAATYFSQQRWTPAKHGRAAQLWPHQDESVRFPELLAGAGVPTVTFASAWWLVDKYGVVRGFTEEKVVHGRRPLGYGFTDATALVDAALERLRAYKSGPLFLYMHWMEPHAPYTAGGKKGTGWENYVNEIAVADGQLGRLVDLLESRQLLDRTTFIISADHGEEFREHGGTQHARTLYEEVVRVPLFIRVPGVAPHAVTEPVSLIDVGPTILDLFGVATPGQYMGQSLVPFLRGENPILTRQIIAEGRLKQSLVTRDGEKAIRDLFWGTVEAYDLRVDPKEKKSDLETPGARDALNRLQRFFDVHTYRVGGYKPPMRK